ncbi:MAG: hypothetical protein WCH05_02805 [Chlorobiaceae bacterium]
MIAKEDLLQKLTRAMKSEDALISLYTKHLQRVAGYSALKKSVQPELVSILQKLKTESEDHESAMIALEASIIKSDRNAY